MSNVKLILISTRVHSLLLFQQEKIIQNRRWSHIQYYSTRRTTILAIIILIKYVPRVAKISIFVFVKLRLMPHQGRFEAKFQAVSTQWINRWSKIGPKSAMNLKARLSGKDFYQHAQLFRQGINDNSPMLSIEINFKNWNTCLSDK